MIGAERNGPVLRLTLDNPPANALSLEVVEALRSELDSARDDSTVRMVVIASSGTLFSAGHDLKQLRTHRDDGDGGKAYFEQTFAACAALMQGIVEHPRPIVAEVDGIATAAGCQLVATCDLAIASDRSKFGVNGIDVGLFCTTPAVALTRNIGAKRAMELLLTGKLIDAATALEFGLVNRVVPAEDLADAVAELTATIAAKSPQAIRFGKQAVRKQMGISLAEAYDAASRTMVENLLASDADEGISAFLERRQPNFS